MTKKDWEDIEVNRRDSDDVRFESNLVQSIYDGIEFLKDESTVILKELDSTQFKQNIDEFDIEEFGEKTINHFEILVDDLSQFKDEIIDSDNISDFVKESSKNAKKALNRDEDYIRRARKRIDSETEESNLRACVLCDKAIRVNPKNTEAYYLKGLALMNLEKYDEAIEEFINVLVLDENNLKARLAIADVNRLNGDYDDAISVYDSVLNIEESYDAYKGKALTYYECDEFKKAGDEFAKANSIKTLDSESKKLWDECLEN